MAPGEFHGRCGCYPSLPSTLGFDLSRLLPLAHTGCVPLTGDTLRCTSRRKPVHVRVVNVKLIFELRQTDGGRVCPRFGF